MKSFPLAVASLVVVCLPAVAAGPRVTVVVGPEAPRLERFAAQELAGQFKQLFDARVEVTDGAPGGDGQLIFLGSPQTNPAIKATTAGVWPKLSDQGLVLRSVQRNGPKFLLVGGGSPVATLWAVYELGHRLGVRYLVSGDVLPAEPPAFKLDGFDVVMEPTLRTRTWRTVNDFAVGPESWGLAEHRRVLRQLAKLKFNRVMLSVYPWQPFVHFEFKGVKKSTALSWYGYRYPVDGDTAGRAAFGGLKEFENPDLAGKKTYADKTAAGVALARGIIDSARELGMSTALAISFQHSGIRSLEFT